MSTRALDRRPVVADGTLLIDVDQVTKTFDTLDGPLPVLDGVSLEVRAGEIVALLGKSGSGKSTLLRCVAGLIAPSSGTVAFRGEPVNGPNAGTAMVFQSFALLPWLTVQQNVELGLEARGVEPVERARRADRAIDLIGLDGFESAYPKELSGGMRQRVGLRPGVGGRARGVADGRAVQRLGRADGGEPAGRAVGAVGQRRVPGRGDRARHPQHRGGGPPGRPGHRARFQPGADQGRAAGGAAPAP